MVRTLSTLFQIVHCHVSKIISSFEMNKNGHRHKREIVKVYSVDFDVTKTDKRQLQSLQKGHLHA